MTHLLAASSSWLITPDVGLTIWTLVVFAISLFILIKAVFPRIGAALDQRRKAIDDSIDAAERTRREADELLVEYRERLREARQEAEEIVERARQAAAVNEREARTEAQARREQMLEQTRRDIEAETRRVLDEILRDVVDLTVHGHRTGDAQGAHRGGPATAGRGRAVRARLLGPERRTGPATVSSKTPS